MNCKKCNAELEEGVQICPECGMNQAEAAENAAPAEVKVEKKEPKMVPLRMVIAVAVVVALIAVFAVVIFGGLIGKQNVDPTEGTVPSQEVVSGATIPGTGLNDVSCKGSYTVSDEEALETARRLAREEGLMCGISSGTNVAAAIALAKKLGPGKTVVTVLPDTAERYFSTPLFEE